MTDCPSWFFREEHFFLPVNLSLRLNYRESLSSPSVSSRALPTSIHHHRFSKQNSTVQFLPIKASWQSFHRLPWNFSHDLDSRARRLESGKAPFQILPVLGEPQCLLSPPLKCNLRIPFTFTYGACAETSPTFSGALVVEEI